MSTKRHGEKIVSDLANLIVWSFDGVASLTSSQLHNLFEETYGSKFVGSAIAKLRRSGIIGGRAKTGYSLSPAGSRQLETLRFKRIISTDKWDRKWRLISYDIPESNRLARETIRRLIKELGCKQMQLSLWAHPHPCLRQFELIRDTYGLKNHIFLLEVEHSGQFNELLRLFRKTYPKL